MQTFDMETATTFSFLKFLKFTLLAVFIGLILTEAIYNSAKANDVSIFIKTIGEKLTSSTTELSKASKEVITQGAWYVATDDFYTGIWKFITINSAFFLSFYTLFMWIYVFSWIVARTPFSDTTKSFNNFMFGIIIFFLIQGIFTLSMSGVNKEIDCFNSCEKSAIGYFISPITSLKDFAIAVDYILKPLFSAVEKTHV